jgi:PAS domain S-box-containing protein
VDVASFMRELTRVHTLADQLHQRLQAEAVPESSPLAETVAELGTALEGLQVAEEELRVQTDTLVAAQEQLAAQRDRYRELFESAPAPYLITDPAGTVRAANLRAVRLLGIPHEVLIGRPLVMFVVAEDRQRFPEWLGQLGSSTAAPEWTLRLQPRRRQPVPVTLAVHVARDEKERVRELRCLLRPLPQRPASTPKSVDQATDTQPAADRPAAPAAAPQLPAWSDLTVVLQEVVAAATALLRADGAGLMLIGEDGALQWVTATVVNAQAFEQAERDLQEGPCIEAFVHDRVVGTRDLSAEVRWPRFGQVAASHGFRAVLAAPVSLDGRPVGTCNALMRTPRDWHEADHGAIRGFATVLGRLIGLAAEATSKGRLAEQLQYALDHRLVVEQAKGILIERKGLAPSEAFALLRRTARSSSRTLVDVAADVIAGRRL